MRGMNLIIPPICDVTVPLLGAYQLAGFADEKGFPFVVHDCNIAFCEAIVSYSISKSKSDTSQSDLEEIAVSGFLNSFPEIKDFDTFITSLKKCTNRSQYWKLMDFLRACYDLFSLQFTDIRFRIDGFDSEYEWNIWEDIDEFVKRHKGGILNNRLNNILDTLSLYDTVGISITFESQLLISLLMCDAIRTKIPRAKIIIGGGFVNSFIDSKDSMGPLSKYCDCVFAGEGEALIDFLANRKFDEIMGQSDGQTLFVTPESICNVRLRVTPPVFGKDVMGKFVSPQRIIPLRFSYDCYWGKCKFCADNEKHFCLEKQYDIDRMIEFCTTAYTNKLFDGVYFLDSAISPSHTRRFAQSLVENGISFPWGTNFRFETAFDDDNLVSIMKQSGLVFAKFGLESGSQKVLDLMDKGTNIRTAASIIRKFRKHGILVHTYVMAAYPGETEDDRCNTAQFLLSEDSHPDNYNCSEFILYGNAKIAENFHDKLNVDSGKDGWHSASYSFTNDTIKLFISDTRKQFNNKFSPQSILLSTGHTIAFAGRLKDDERTKNNQLYVCINKKVAFKVVDGNSYLVWWKRNRGYAFIKGVWAEWLHSSLMEGVALKNLSMLGVSSHVIDTLIEEGCLEYCNSGNYKTNNVIPNETLFSVEQHSRFEYLKWYGYYDAE